MSVRLDRHGGLTWLTLENGRGNVLDGDTVRALAAAVVEAARDPELRLLAFRAVGRDFSWGASVPEHVAHLAPAMLAELHQFFRVLEGTAVPTAAAVRGRCLGGGWELAGWCGHVVCAPDAVVGLPEITLGVFPPIGSLLLRWRAGGARATDLVISGRTLGAAAAVERGLVEEVAEDPEAAVLRWYETHLAPLSAASLKLAWRAARLPVARFLEEDLPRLERLYLDELLLTHDANEGIAAFLEKRPVHYLHR